MSCHACHTHKWYTHSYEMKSAIWSIFLIRFHVMYIMCASPSFFPFIVSVCCFLFLYFKGCSRGPLPRIFSTGDCRPIGSKYSVESAIMRRSMTLSALHFLYKKGEGVSVRVPNRRLSFWDWGCFFLIYRSPCRDPFRLVGPPQEKSKNSLLFIPAHVHTPTGT